MDRNFFQHELAKEHQREVSKEMATHHILREAGSNVPSVKRAVRTALRVAPVAISVIILILLNFPG